MTQKIIFRADGNAKTGLGHLYRLFSLVEMVKDSIEFVFLTKETSTHSVFPIEYNIRNIPVEIDIIEEPEWIASIFSSTENTIILDGYHFTSLYQKKIKQLGFKLIYIDDLMKEHMYADVVVNHSAFVQKTDYKAESYTKFALGTEYAILRPSFLEAIKKKKIIEKIDSVFVCFGGADFGDLSLKATKAMLNLCQIKEINVVLGGAYNHSSIYDLANKNDKIKIYKNLKEKELVQVMQQCNFAIVPASTILYEICTVKMPVLAGFYVENQKNIYQACLEKEVIYEGGNFENYSVEIFEQKTLEILNFNDYEEKIYKQSLFFDSKIRNRYMNLFSYIKYRELKAEDDVLLYEWANDKLSRVNSYNSNFISWEEHKNWFVEKLNNKNVIIFIAELNDIPSGFIRFEIQKNHTIISVFVSEKFRGKSLAKKFIKDTSKKYFNMNSLPIHAYIKKENIASIKSFEKSGYLRLREEKIKGIESYIYQLKKHDK